MQSRGAPTTDKFSYRMLIGSPHGHPTHPGQRPHRRREREATHRRSGAARRGDHPLGRSSLTRLGSGRSVVERIRGAALHRSAPRPRVRASTGLLEGAIALGQALQELPGSCLAAVGGAAIHRVLAGIPGRGGGSMVGRRPKTGSGGPLSGPGGVGVGVGLGPFEDRESRPRRLTAIIVDFCNLTGNPI